MKFSSLLTDYRLSMVIDTSVVINLHACGHGVQIVAAIPNPILIPRIAVDELQFGTAERNFLQSLFDSRLVMPVELDEDEYLVFQELTSISPTVDDGEAATIAVSHGRNALAIIDDRKGRARATSVIPSSEPGWSLDLLCHFEVISQLGSTVHTEAIYLALHKGRMRIPAQRTDEVISLVGIERAKECTCLPGYKERFGLRSTNSAP